MIMIANGQLSTDSFGAASSIIEETGFRPPQYALDPFESKPVRAGAVNQ